ncbi:unnamed protein product [Periconia digitata]|uniref:Uncharacterized protein n=1 Tax=Periconia digitata TaxID=1303443 RepID=A0A9W4UFD6_9PLEO|nr:unnamed protein product [Periconia digitata]
MANCLCTNSCPSSPVSCGSDSCRGINNPNGGNSICTFGTSAGCPCTSKCQVDFCDTTPGCNGYNTKNGAAHCTAGEYAGCYCISLCPLKPAAPLSCTDSGCVGLNNLGGKEFCTAGKYQGCSCTSACPSSKPACSSCEGEEGICTTGAAYGCACSGSSSKREAQNSKTRRDTSQQSNPIQSSRYVVTPPGFGIDSPTAESYRRDQIQQALYDAVVLFNNGETIMAAGGERYPAPMFFTGPGLTTVRGALPAGEMNPNDLVQYPIAKNGEDNYAPFVDGATVGPDRVVFHGTSGQFVALITHRGETQGYWHAAIAPHSSSAGLSSDQVAVSTLDQDPYPWFSQIWANGASSNQAWNIPLMPGTVTNTTTDNEDGDFAGCLDQDKYKTLDDVLGDLQFPVVCMSVYVLNAVSTVMSDALEKFTAIMADGYQAKYNAYKILVHNQAKLAWENLRNSHLDDLWNCFEVHNGANQSIGCGRFNNGGNYYYVEKDPDNFCHKLDMDYNLDCSWIVQSVISYRDPAVNGGANCEKTGVNCPINGQMFFPDLDLNFAVADPGAAISQSLGNYTDLSSWLDDSAISSGFGMLGPLEDDIIDGASMTVFTVQAAVEAMQQVADVGEEAAEEQKKETIMAFILAFLFVVPGIGEAVEGIDILAQVATITRLIDFAGNTAVDLYGIVEDPSSAPMAIAGILLGVGNLRDRNTDAWEEAAQIRRKMDDAVVGSMGKTVSDGMGKIKKLVKECSL